MNKHISRLLLLDYAQGKIEDEEENGRITDHLSECGYCRKVLKSHFYLLENHEALLELFFPGVQAIAENEEVEPEALAEAGILPGKVIQSIIDKIQVLKVQGTKIGIEIKNEVAQFLDAIRMQTHLEEFLVPLKVENVHLLGTGETGEPEEKKLKFLTHDITLWFWPLEDFTSGDFDFEFTGKFLYVIYESENYREIIGRKLRLATTIGAPFVFSADFREGDQNALAKCRIEFEEPLHGLDSAYTFFFYID